MGNILNLDIRMTGKYCHGKKNGRLKSFFKDDQEVST